MTGGRYDRLGDSTCPTGLEEQAKKQDHTRPATQRTRQPTARLRAKRHFYTSPAWRSTSRYVATSPGPLGTAGGATRGSAGPSDAITPSVIFIVGAGEAGARAR